MKIEILDQRHPSFAEAELLDYRALYQGGKAWRRRATSFIPKRPAEEADAWMERVQAATYTNDCAPLIDAIPAHLTSSPLEVTGWPSDWWEAWASDVDRQGHDLTRYIAERVTDALVEGATYVYVGMPRREVEVDSRATEEQLGLLNAYLTAWQAHQAIWWTDDAHGRLTAIVFRDSREHMVFGEERKTYRRWTYMDARVIRVFEAEESASPQSRATDHATEVATIAHGYGRIPVVRMQLDASQHAMGVLHDPAVALLRARNASTFALEKTAFAMPVFYTDMMMEDVVVGAGRFLKLQPKDRVEWSEPAGTSDASLAADIASKRDDLYRALRSLFQSAHSDSLQEQSGESKSQDWKAFEVYLEGLRREVIGFARELLLTVAAARGEQATELEVGGLEGWGTSDPTGWLANLVVAEPWLELSDTAKREAAHRAVEALLQDLTPEIKQQIHDEIEAADLTPKTPFAVPFGGGFGGGAGGV